MTRALPWLVVGLVALLVLLILGRWLQTVLKLCFRTCGGFLFLSLLQSTGLGLGLGANMANALVLGVLGAPGFGLLLMVQWVLSGAV